MLAGLKERVREHCPNPYTIKVYVGALGVSKTRTMSSTFMENQMFIVVIINVKMATLGTLAKKSLGFHQEQKGVSDTENLEDNISHFSTSSLLSDHIQFPSFFRTVPSDAFQSKGLAQLLLHFAWTWVGLLAFGNDYGQEGIWIIKKELLKAGACVAFTEFIISKSQKSDYVRISKVIRESTAKVVLVFANDVLFALLLEEMLYQNITGKIFVASEGWSTSNILGVEKYKSLLGGSIGFAFYSSDISGFKEFVTSIHPQTHNSSDKSLEEIFWEQTFGCKFYSQVNSTKLCTGNEDLSTVENVYTDMTNLRGSFSIYTSVHVIAKALHDMNTCWQGGGPFNNGTCADMRDFKPWQLKHYIQNVRVQLKNGREVFFDKNGDLPAMYDIVNWQQGSNRVIKKLKVGSYDASVTGGNIFSINTNAIEWPTGKGQVPKSVCSEPCLPGFQRVVREGEPVCCFDCVPCPYGAFSNKTDSDQCFECQWDFWPNAQRTECIPKSVEYLSYEGPLGSALTATGISSSIITVLILCLFIRRRFTPIVKANNFSLSCILLFSMSLCFLCSLNFIGYPQAQKCLMRQVVFGMVFAVCISTVLAKTIMVVFAFMATKPNSKLKHWTSPKVSYMIIITCSFIQLFLCIFWLSFTPPFFEYNTRTHPEIVIAECNEGSAASFWSMLGYLGLLSSISFIVAFLARTLPDSFNEAKYITFSMLAFLSVWVSYIPATLSARGQYTVALEVFAILSSSWALVICMFFPKCFIILFRPDMNSKEHLMGKVKGRTL
ncbi:extracellular calcium-sensing receptor-like [Gastrophryne carolinensis]